MLNPTLLSEQLSDLADMQKRQGKTKALHDLLQANPDRRVTLSVNWQHKSAALTVYDNTGSSSTADSPELRTAVRHFLPQIVALALELQQAAVEEMSKALSEDLLDAAVELRK